jgi:integrase
MVSGRSQKAKVQDTTPHDLRHKCASLAVSAGVNVLALQRMLGHTSAKMKLDTYSDLFDDDLDAVAVTLHTRYSRRSVGNTWARAANETSDKAPKTPLPARKPEGTECGRRDSNPQALSSTGT